MTESLLSRIPLTLENLKLLDPFVRAAEPTMDALVANETVKDAFQGKWLGHALHPAVAVLPMGAWVSALLLDLSDTDPSGRAARRLIGFGVLVTPVVATSGWAQLQEGELREKRVGVVHAGLNGVVWAGQIGSWFLRGRGHHAAGRALSLASMAAKGFGSFLGGHLAVARELATKDQVFEQTND